MHLLDTLDVCFKKIANKVCTTDNIVNSSAIYFGLEGFAHAKRDCEADENCKSIVVLGGEQFLLCKSGANEVEDYDSADVWVKGIF